MLYRKVGKMDYENKHSYTTAGIALEAAYRAKTIPSADGDRAAHKRPEEG
jgi:hypothetical protein